MKMKTCLTLVAVGGLSFALNAQTPAPPKPAASAGLLNDYLRKQESAFSRQVHGWPLAPVRTGGRGGRHEDLAGSP